MARWRLIGIVSAALLSAWGVSFASNKSLIAATDRSAEQYRVNAADELKRIDRSPMTDLANVAGVLDMLRTHAGRLRQSRPADADARELRPRASAAAWFRRRETTYRQALERMFRSRLILRLERQIEAGMNDPMVLYETLKVYLMLGGKAPKVDKELVEAWMRKDWEENLYPGPTNRSLREDLDAASARHARSWRQPQADLRAERPAGRIRRSARWRA